MPNLTCPHCLGEVPRGARVCRGCSAEIEYGTPAGAYVAALAVAGAVGWKTGDSFHFIAGWLIFALMLGGGIYACMHLFRNRVEFKRVYRTR